MGNIRWCDCRNCMLSWCMAAADQVQPSRRRACAFAPPRKASQKTNVALVVSRHRHRLILSLLVALHGDYTWIWSALAVSHCNLAGRDFADRVPQEGNRE